MELGISTASLFARFPLEDSFSQIKACGASVCEVFLNTFSEYEPAFISLVDRRIKESGLTPYSVHPMGVQFEAQLFSIHPRQRQDAWALYEKVLQGAKTLGAKYYVFHGSALLRGAARNLELTRIGPITRDLCALAHSYGVTLTWENVSWCLFSEPAFAARILDAAKTDWLYFTLDVKQAARSGQEWPGYLAAIGDKLANVHLCDYRIEKDRAVPLLPFEGNCNFAALKRALDDMGYTGPAFVEVYSDLYGDMDAFTNSYRRLKQVFQ